MWRQRRAWASLVVCLFVAGGGAYRYWATRHDPVLRSVSMDAMMPRFFELDEHTSRLYIESADPQRPLIVLDTRTGNSVDLPGAFRQITGMPNDDILSGHSFDVGSRPGQMLMFDTRSNTLLKTIPVPWQGQDIWDNLDTRRDRDLVAFFDAPVMLVIDAHSGRVLRTVRACTSQSGPVISQRTQRIFVSCADGRILVFDSATYQLVASRNPTAIGTAAYKTILVDEATRRVFLPGASGYGVLDARTGAVLRTLPLLNWWVGTQDILPGSHDVVMAPFVPPSLGQPPHAVLVLDGRSGAILHRWRVPENPLQVLVNPLTGHVLVASAGPWDISGAPDSGGTVSVLDAHTGAIVQQIRTGVLPGGLAADPRTRHLFVMNFNTNNDGQSLVRTYPDGWWPQFQRQLKKGAGWLPFTAPAPPSPPVYATVMMLDLAML